jgi:hypothetical protein
VVGFADDLSIATSHKDPLVATKNLQIVCDHIGAWLESRKLQLYGGKTVFMIFARRSSSGSSEPLFLSIKGVQISPSLDASFLGLTSDPNLKWHRHLQGKIGLAKRAMFAASSCIRQAFDSDGHRLRFLYSTVFEPIFSYGASVWISAVRDKAAVKKNSGFFNSRYVE